MPDVLGKEEINQLLKKFPKDSVKAEQEDQKILKYYNFSRPCCFTESEHTVLSDFHELFTRSVRYSVSDRLHTYTAFHVSSVDELTFEEFIRSIPDPNFLYILTISRFPFSIIFEVELPLIHAVIDRLAGGSGDSKKNNNITELEVRLLKDFMPAVISPFIKMWQTRITCSPDTQNIKIHPGLATCMSPRTMIVLVSIESRIGDTEGMINICYPVHFIKATIFKPAIPIGKMKVERIKDYDRLINMENLMYGIYNQFSIGNFSIQTITGFKGSTECIIHKDTVSTWKYIPLTRD